MNESGTGGNRGSLSMRGDATVSGTDYEFRVSGRLSDQARRAVGDFGELHVVESPPETLLYCVGADESRLHGVLVLLEQLGLHVVSVARAQTPRRSRGQPG